MRKIPVAMAFGRVLPLVLLALPSLSLAGNFQILLPNPIQGGANNFFEFLKLVYDNVLMPVGGVAVALGIIWSGFLFVKAQGKPQEIVTAQKTFFWTVVGGLVILGSWVIANGISCTINQIRGIPCTAF